MNFNFYKAILILSIVTSVTSCGSSDNASNNADASYTDLNITAGFSSAYLNQKTFYRPNNYYGTHFIETYSFTDSEVFWDDNLFNNSGSSAYSIVSSNGISGVIQYNDGVYDLHYSVHSVELDHVKVCYTYTGINSVAPCDVSQAISWYFNRSSAENNYP